MSNVKVKVLQKKPQKKLQKNKKLQKEVLLALLDKIQVLQESSKILVSVLTLVSEMLNVKARVFQKRPYKKHKKLLNRVLLYLTVVLPDKFQILQEPEIIVFIPASVSVHVPVMT